DNPGYGCGTKLPHNITSLVGVMDGAASDLRTGLPWQMVELHEPVRQLFVIETTPETMLAVLGRNPEMERLFRNRWAYLALLDPGSPTIQVYRDGAFHPYRPTVDHLPRAASSVDWYRGWRDHLEFAQIVPK
ncbi:MAG TPA: putative inorganic carbon transporter subunit DabA, partial [Fimbriiglobus sp.]|nr:putative inorganic carbon transporter subunit DabA [Fimbriiglobus sp.]